MDRTFLASLVILLLIVLLALMVLGWQQRKRRQRDIAAPKTAPATTGTALGEYVGKYVATTRAGDRLDRIAVHGLGFRGGVSVAVSSDGVLFALDGGHDVWIPRADILDTARATWTIDRVVEPDGLHLIEWALGETSVDSYLRMDNPTAFDAALATLTEGKRS